MALLAQRWNRVVDFGSPMTAWTPEMLAQHKEKTMTKSWKPEVKTAGDDKWYGNSLAFATRKEAEWSAKELFERWTLATDHRAVESDEPVNAEIVDGVFRMLEVA